MINVLIDGNINWCIYWLIHWLMDALIDGCINWWIHWLMDAFINGCIYWWIHWLMDALIYGCIDRWMHWWMHLLMNSLIDLRDSLIIGYCRNVNHSFITWSGVATRHLIGDETLSTQGLVGGRLMSRQQNRLIEIF